LRWRLRRERRAQQYRLKGRRIIIVLKIKRVYDPPSKDDGKRILIDRLWPRGLRKKDAQIDDWIKEISPSNELRKWYGHDPAKWGEFKKRYFSELHGQPERIEEIVNASRKGTVTLLFGSKEERINNAEALKEYIEARTHAHLRRKAA
jgi:uncharacterized protein YeaO (DUF488 family)